MASVSSLECDSNKNYIKLIKQNQNYPGEERYTILAGETQLVTTESMIRYEIQTFEYCIDKTTNNQYTLKLEDTIGDGWDSGAWLELQGVYGNILFKGYLNAGRNLEVALSLYTPVEKESVWKFSNSAAGDWASSSTVSGCLFPRDRRLPLRARNTSVSTSPESLVLLLTKFALTTSMV